MPAVAPPTTTAVQLWSDWSDWSDWSACADGADLRHLDRSVCPDRSSETADRSHRPSRSRPPWTDRRDRRVANLVAIQRAPSARWTLAVIVATARPTSAANIASAMTTMTGLTPEPGAAEQALGIAEHASWITQNRDSAGITSYSVTPAGHRLITDLLELHAVGPTTPADFSGQDQTHPATFGRDNQRLTVRQQRVAVLVAVGLTSRQAAVALGCRPRTIDNHVAKILTTLGLARRQELARTVAADPFLATLVHLEPASKPALDERSLFPIRPEPARPAPANTTTAEVDHPSQAPARPSTQAAEAGHGITTRPDHRSVTPKDRRSPRPPHRRVACAKVHRAATTSIPAPRWTSGEPPMTASPDTGALNPTHAAAGTAHLWRAWLDPAHRSRRPPGSAVTAPVTAGQPPVPTSTLERNKSMDGGARDPPAWPRLPAELPTSRRKSPPPCPIVRATRRALPASKEQLWHPTEPPRATANCPGRPRRGVGHHHRQAGRAPPRRHQQYHGRPPWRRPNFSNVCSPRRDATRTRRRDPCRHVHHRRQLHCGGPAVRPPIPMLPQHCRRHVDAWPGPAQRAPAYLLTSRRARPHQFWRRPSPPTSPPWAEPISSTSPTRADEAHGCVGRPRGNARPHSSHSGRYSMSRSGSIYVGLATSRADRLRPELSLPELSSFGISSSAPMTVVAGAAAVMLALGVPGTPLIFLAVSAVAAPVGGGLRRALSRHVQSAGAQAAFIARGLGRTAGVAAQGVALVAYGGDLRVPVRPVRRGRRAGGHPLDGIRRAVVGVGLAGAPP